MDLVTIVSLVIAVIAALAALLVIPEVRSWLRLDKQPPPLSDDQKPIVDPATLTRRNP